jgi:hypothetical protein
VRRLLEKSVADQKERNLLRDNTLPGVHHGRQTSHQTRVNYRSPGGIIILFLDTNYDETLGGGEVPRRCVLLHDARQFAELLGGECPRGNSHRQRIVAITLLSQTAMPALFLAVDCGLAKVLVNFG